jgi:hypothetical protein
MYLMNPTIIEIKPYTHKELSGIYGVSKPTFTKWLLPFQDQIGERQGHFYTISQVKVIFDKLGLPGKFDQISIWSFFISSWALFNDPERIALLL